MYQENRMTSSTKTRSRVNPSRPAPSSLSVRLILAPTVHKAGVVRIAMGCKCADYFLRLVPADWGRGFRLQEMGPASAEDYHVNLDGEQSTCDCMGHLRWGHCKHVEGLLVLLRKRSAGTAPVGPMNAPGGAEK
jgi:hypothetical protein